MLTGLSGLAELSNMLAGMELPGQLDFENLKVAPAANIPFLFRVLLIIVPAYAIAHFFLFTARVNCSRRNHTATNQN